MGRTKKFINKENAVKFYLGHRSLRDPLYLEESIGERVLVPAEPIKNSKLAREFQEPTRRQETEEEIEKRKEEERKYGIYFEDDYNYLQHLKEIEDDFEVEAQEYVEEEKEEKIDVSTINKPKKLMLPSSVFASKYEEEVGYFNQDAPNSDPKIGWDSEIVETLDDESKFEFDKDDNQLDDDFFIKANDEKLDGINEEDDNDDDYEDCDSDEDDDESDDKKNYYKGLYKYEHDNEDDKFETKSHFTNYSMTSSVIRRNEKLKFVDEAFEELIKKQYAEDQMGALDTECEDITGYRDTNNIVIQHALEDFQKKTKKILYEVEHNENKLEKVDEDDETDDDESSDEEEEEYEYIYVKEKPEDPIDCESVLSLTSNNCIKTNVIKEENLKIRLSKKTGVPMNVLKEKPISKNLMEKIDYKITRVLPEIPERKKDESKEEKKARKQAIKDQKRVRRQEKKINKLAFKEEKMKQTNQMGNLNQRVVPIKL